MATLAASKVARRTLVGGSIAAGLLAVLWATNVADSPYPILAVTAALLVACTWEVHRMGALRGRGLGWILGAGALVCLVHTFAAIGEAGDFARGDAGFGVLWMLGAAALSASAIVVAYALLRSTSRLVRIAAVLAPLYFVAPHWSWTGPLCAVALFFVALRLTVFGAERRGEVIGVVVLGTLLVVSLPGLTWIWIGAGFWPLVALIAIAKIGDTAAYYVGSAIGRHRPFPAISPGKSTEGFVGSFVAGAAAGALAVEIGWLPDAPHGWVGGLAAGAVVNVAAQASDLVESWVKRAAGVKDSGSWFGPSGGVLDLVDSFFFAAPAALAVWPMVLRFEPA